LALLHDVLGSRRHRTWSPTYESIMITYLNLCLQLSKSREAKDGLHQYRNLSQSQAPGSLEKVIRYVMEQAEMKCAKAKANADAIASLNLTSTATTADLDGEDGAPVASPDSILLSTMSADPQKTQRDSTLLLPSLKFLWETYRAILDILKSNSKLEHVYHAAALGALRFCRLYKRRTEFRRLCDMMRVHLGNLQKYGGGGEAAMAAAAAAAAAAAEDPAAAAAATAAVDGKTNNRVRGWEGWTSESIELHLQTRFSQLETASVLHLYTEGFRTVEDIYNILQISHARRKTNPTAPPPKAKLIAAYYEKLTTLFWVSENYLFHAFAWYKYYTLCKEFNRGMSEEMKQKQASAVLLATLCIPSTPKQNSSSTKQRLSSSTGSAQAHGITSTIEDDIVKEKMARMATLLGFHTRHPSREALLTEIRSKNLMDAVPVYLKKLYLLLEENSDPLIMVETAKPLLEQLKEDIGEDTTTTDATTPTDDELTEDSTLRRYVNPLTSVLLTKLLLNLSAAYHTVSMDHLRKLTDGLDIAFDQVEKAIVLFTQTKTLSVRIDHRAGCLRFGDAQLESDLMRSQLTTLANALDSLVTSTIQPPDASENQKKRAALFADIRTNLASQHNMVLERKELIEKRKEEVERLAQEKIRDEARIKAERDKAAKVEEEKRLQREQKLREKEKLRKIQKEMEDMEKKKYLQAMGRSVDNLTEEEMANIDTAALAKEHAAKANKKKETAERKTKEAAKRLDYLVRAVRIEELPQIQKRYQEKSNEDKRRYEVDTVEKAKLAKEQWEADVKEKAELTKHDVFSCMDEFRSMAMVGRKKQHKILCKAEDEHAELEAEKAKIARARERKEDEAKRQAEEEARLKAEEEARKAEEEATRKEQERRRKAIEEEERRKAEMDRMNAERNKRENERRVPAPMESRGGGSRYVPPSQRGGGGGGSGGGGFGDNRGSRWQGGGRYEGRGGGNSDRWGSGGGDRRSGGTSDRDRGGSGGGDRWGAGGSGGDRGGGGYSDRDRGGSGGGVRWGAGGSGGDRGGYGDRDRDRTGGGYGRRDDRAAGGGGGGSRRF